MEKTNFHPTFNERPHQMTLRPKELLPNKSYDFSDDNAEFSEFNNEDTTYFYNFLFELY